MSLSNYMQSAPTEQGAGIDFFRGAYLFFPGSQTKRMGGVHPRTTSIFMAMADEAWKIRPNVHSLAGTDDVWRP